ncbi:unnamed protein product [Rhodiola kirilowii]
MAGNYRFAMDQKDIGRFLVTTIESAIQDRLIDKEMRMQHKEQCAERLAAEDESSDNDKEVRYADQAVLANLDWGIDALEEAINTSNMETKVARLNHAEKMLHVCAMLNSSQKTAGVPNSYLSAWAHLNLSYLWKLRNNIQKSVLHILEMFSVDPFFARIDFAPDMWKSLFLPHMSSIVGWYSESRHKLVMELIPDSADLSFTADFDQLFRESLVFSMRPDQLEKTQKLEQLYGESLDENTKLYARYYKDCMNMDLPTNKKVVPMLPIAEPPMTPLHEVSRLIPDYVQFGPIFPISAGFSPKTKSKDEAREASRLSISSSSPQIVEDALWDQNTVAEENEDVLEYDPYVNSLARIHKLPSPKLRMKVDYTSPRAQPSRMKNQPLSPRSFSPIESPKTPSPRIPSPRPNTLSNKESPTLLRLLSCRTDSSSTASLPISPDLYNDSTLTFIDSDGERVAVSLISIKAEDQISRRKNLSINRHMNLDSPHKSLPSSDQITPRTRPPKDFVCPITSQAFSDPVTLETGQTYERKAIQEWLERGNTTCPITRQTLSATVLPKTNYVLKRLITSWNEQNPEVAKDWSCSNTPKSSYTLPSSNESSLKSTLSGSYHLPVHTHMGDHYNDKSRRFRRTNVTTSPTSVISQAAVEIIINELKPHIACICNSVDLQQCEAAVLEIARIWIESKADAGIHPYLSEPTVANGFVEVLSASPNREVLRKTIFILSELICANESVGDSLTSVDTDLDCLTTLLKNGLGEASVLIYQLRPVYAQLFVYDLIPSLVHLVLNRNECLDDFQLAMDPKDAAIALIEQILIGGDENSRTVKAISVISGNMLPHLVKCLDGEEGRQSVISILLCCMHADKSCKNLIATTIELSPVLELLHAGNDGTKAVCIEFLSQLVQLNRRLICNTILQKIRDEGAFSTMHTLLVYLQMAPMEQQPVIATLLVQLDLLVEPRKMSIYREEAIETLIEALRRKEFPSIQAMALDALVSLCGHLTASGNSYTEAWLLKIAGFDQTSNSLIVSETEGLYENELKDEADEKATNLWEKRVAFVLSNYEKGSIFKALEECFKSNSLRMAKTCLVMATWLTYMIYKLPDSGVREVARTSLLDQFINILRFSKNFEEKVFATLALKSFISDQGALEELGVYAKSIYNVLRKLKRSSAVVTDILKALINLPSVNASELWSCVEITEIDSSANGDVLCLLHKKSRVYSSHADGTIKVWDAAKKTMRLLHEIRIHTKAVTCLCVAPSGEILFSGSLDKTIRVWEITSEAIHSLEVHDVREPVYALAANSNVACFASHVTGMKVYTWSGVPRQVNMSRHVRSLALMGEKVYCGCNGYSIQEVDLLSFSVTTFYSGTRKFLGKQTINSLYIHDGHLYTAGTSIDGIAGRVFSLSNIAPIGSFTTNMDIQQLSINSDYIFTSTKCGIIEVWLKERVARVASIKVGGGNAKVTSMVSDRHGEMLYAGSSDGKIQVWALD